MLFFASGCSLDSRIDVEKNVKYSGEEIFKSIYFLNGKVVNEISHLQEMKNIIEDQDLTETMLAIEDFQIEIIDKIKAEDTSFFINFHNNMQSGDHLKISQALTQSLDQLIEKSKDILKDQIDDIMYDLNHQNTNEIKELLGQDNIKELELFKNDPKKLKDFLFNEFLSGSYVGSSSRKTCLVLAFGLYVVAGGAFDVGISTNVVVGMNYALYAYTYINTTGDTGQTWMFFNLGVISGGGDDCTIHDCDRMNYSNFNSQSRKRTENLSTELFINEIAENLKYHAP